MIQSVVLLVTSFLVFILSVLIFIKSRQKISYFYALALLMTAFWNLSEFMVVATTNSALFWSRMAIASMVFVPWALFVFVNNYPRLKIPLSQTIYGLLALPSFFFFLASQTSGLIQSLDMVTKKATFGSLQGPYTLFMVIGFTIILAILFHNVLVYKEWEKVVSQYLFIGHLIAICTGIAFSLILPYFGYSHLYVLGPSACLLLVAITGYAILRHRLLAIQFFIRKVLYFGLMILAVTIISSITIFGLGYLFEELLHVNRAYTVVAASTVIVLVFSQLKDWIDRYTDQLFFNVSYNYQSTLKSFSQTLTNIVDWDAITETVVSTLNRILRTGYTAMYYLNDQGLFQLSHCAGPIQPEQDRIYRDSRLVRLLLHDVQPVIRTELWIRLSEEVGIEDKEFLWGLYNELTALQAGMIIPVRNGNQLIGILVMGSKMSEDMFTPMDVTLVETIVQQSSIALQNANHYQRLQRSVKELSRLNEFIKSINSTFDFDLIFTEISRILCDVFCFDDVMIMFVDSNRQQMVGTYCYGKILEELKAFRIPVNVTLFQRNIQQGMPLTIIDLQLDENPDLQRFALRIQGVMEKGETLVLTLAHGGQLLGAIVAVMVHSETRNIPGNPMLLTTISEEASVALHNALLYHEILEMKEYNEQILANVISGVITIDSDLRVTSFNKMAEELTGYLASDVMGKPISILYDVSPYFSSFEKTFRTGKRQELETTLVKADVKTPVFIATDMISSVPGNRAVVIGIIADLTTVYKLRKHIEQSDRLSSLGTMAAGIAHEIKNPLVPIKAFTQMLPKLWSDEQFREKFVSIVSPQIERINDLCQALLRLGKNHQTEFKTVDFYEILKEVLVLMEGERKRHHAEFITQLDENVIIIGNRNQITQVILNLIMNGLDALPESGGQLFVGLSMHKSGYAEAIIRDTGCGIAKDKLNNIFDPFFTTKETGTGLGLSIVFRIIKEHNGEIMVESEPDRGTTFKLYLPSQYADANLLYADRQVVPTEV